MIKRHQTQMMMALRKRAPMYVTDHGHRGTDMYDVGFSHENLLCFLAYLT